MNWDQIENKWAAMTRRIRADWATDRIEKTGTSLRSMKGPDAVSASIADNRNVPINDAEFKISAK